MICAAPDLVKPCRNSKCDYVIEGGKNLENIVIQKALKRNNGCSESYHKAVKVESVEHHFYSGYTVKSVA